MISRKIYHAIFISFFFICFSCGLGRVNNNISAYSPPPVTPTSSIINEIPQDDGALIYSVVEKMPQFPGGDTELMTFLGKNIKFPTAAREKGVHGKLYAQFVVETDGNLSNIGIRQSLDSILDNEALRVIRLMPQNWSPGEQDGEKVRVKYILPFNFTLR